MTISKRLAERIESAINRTLMGPKPKPSRKCRTVRKVARRHPTKEWRVQGMKAAADVAPLGSFDEIVVGNWLHVEMLNNDSAFCRIGDICFWVKTRTGEITYAEDRSTPPAHVVNIVRVLDQQRELAPR
jgi:hypothetical protein